MIFRIRFTEEALADLVRLQGFLLAQADADPVPAERALEAIRRGIALLETSPFSGRRSAGAGLLLRELVVGFGRAGYVVLFEIEAEAIVTVLAVRHQREDDYC